MRPHTGTRSRGRAQVLVACLLAAFLAAAVAGPVAAAPRSARVEVKVMTFNIWLGGGVVDFDAVPAAIEAADADIVGLQEAGANLQAVADAVGWDHVYPPMALISRYPFVVPPGATDYVYVEVAPGRVVAVSNVHLQAYPYGPYDLRDGASLTQVLGNENAIHMSQMASRFSSLPPLAEAGIPVFLVGDFNVPSVLDWTAGVAAATPRPYDREVAWPVSVRLHELGFRDSFRQAHPDPVAKPGYTWTSGYPGIPADEVHDRIDFVYAAGPARTVASAVVGETPGTLPMDWNGPHSDITVTPWPSDHRAVVSTFTVTPARRPVSLEAVDPTVVQSEPLVLHGYGARKANDWVGIYPAGYLPAQRDLACVRSDTPPPWCRLIDWRYFATGTRDLPRATVVEADVTFDTATLPPGDYDAYLMTKGPAPILASARFTVLDTAAVPGVGTDKAQYVPGEPIQVTFDNGPGNPLDWLGVYARGEIPDGNPASFKWTYVNGQTSGTLTIDAGSAGPTWPLPPGEYDVHLLLNDGYEIAATATFTVVP